MGFTKSTPSAFSTKWLLWQYDELMRSPLPGVNAAPLETNIFEWHGNFYFPEDHEFYPSLVLHFVLHLPKDFPNSTPDIKLVTSISHSHVFGESICFSLLRAFEDHFIGESPDTAFWNPSRSIRSLLESVYIFLTVDEDRYRKYSSHETNWALRESQSCACRGCGHQPANGVIWPAEEHWLAARGAATEESATEERVCSLAKHEDVTLVQTKKEKPVPAKKDAPTISAAERLASIRAVAVDINSNATVPLRVIQQPRVSTTSEERLAILKAKADEMVSRTAKGQIMTSLDKQTREDLKCSMSGVAFDDSKRVVLGFGVNVQRRSDGSILSITTDLSPISMEMFAVGMVRKSALGAPITHFFPLAINEGHWEKAKQVLPGCVNAILRGAREAKELKSEEERLLFVVGEIWKSMAVLMMKGEAHTSEKVLKGFCALHHLLLLASNEADPLLDHSPILKSHVSNAAATNGSNDKPEEDGSKTWVTVVRSKPRVVKKPGSSPLLQYANRKVRGFTQNPYLRHKARCPDFGRFLPMMLLSNVTWTEAKKPFLGELLARGARWILKTHRDLARVQERESSTLSGRAQKSWDAHSTGLKLTAFQIAFFQRVNEWANDTLPADIVREYGRRQKPHLAVRAMYNSMGGRPSKQMLEDFQLEAKGIEAMKGFPEFFKKMGLPMDDLRIQRLLCKAMEDSARFGYHNKRY